MRNSTILTMGEEPGLCATVHYPPWERSLVYAQSVHPPWERSLVYAQSGTNPPWERSLVYAQRPLTTTGEEAGLCAEALNHHGRGAWSMRRGS